MTQLSANQSIAILAGGQSRRMGRDKALLEWRGVSWLERTARIAQEVSSRVAIVGRSKPSDWPLPEVAFLEDEAPGFGPLGGLHSALRWAQRQDSSDVSPSAQLLLLACDMPLLEAKALRWLFEAASREPLRHGLAVQRDETIEPLFSIYTLACLPVIESRLESGEPSSRRFSLQSLIQSGDFAYVTPPAAVAPMLRNLNTPAELEAWMQEQGEA